MSKLTLYQITDEARFLLGLIESGEAFDESGELNEVVAEQLDLIAKDFDLKARDYAYVIKSVEDKKELVDKEIKRLQAIKKYFENTETRMREAIKDTMVALNIDKFNGELVTLSLRNSKAVNVFDMDLLPEEFKRTKITVDADKIKIREAILKNGEKVAGAEIVENKSLNIK